MERIHSAGMPPMKIIVANGQIPMVETSNDRLADTLVGALQHFGFRATRLRLPLPPTFEDFPQHLAACRLFDLQACDGEPGDVLVALDLLTACLRHPRKVLWICQPFGGLQPSALATLATLATTQSAPNPLNLLPSSIRHTLKRSTRLFLTEADRRLCTSESVAAGLQEFADLGMRSLWPPLPGNLPVFPDPGDSSEPSGSEDRKSTVLLMPSEAGYLPVDRILAVVDGSRDHLSFACDSAPPGSLAEAQVELLFQSAEERGLGLVRRQSPREPDPFSGVWLCSVAESSPWPAWRALARKLPMVTTADAGACAELVRESEAGTVVPPDVDLLTEALLGLENHDPSRFTIAGSAKSFLNRSYPTWKSAIDELLRVGR